MKQVLFSCLIFESLNRSKSLEFLPGRTSRISDRSTIVEHINSILLLCIVKPTVRLLELSSVWVLILIAINLSCFCHLYLPRHVIISQKSCTCLLFCRDFEEEKMCSLTKHNTCISLVCGESDIAIKPDHVQRKVHLIEYEKCEKSPANTSPIGRLAFSVKYTCRISHHFSKKPILTFIMDTHLLTSTAVHEVKILFNTSKEQLSSSNEPACSGL